MTEHQPLIDLASPWTVTQRDWNWPSYGYKMSVSEWQRLLARAKQGNPEAEWRIAECYGDGCKNRSGKIIVKRSRRKAAEWFRRAAEHGLATAQNNLGVLLGDGEGVEKNVREALLWLRKAFDGGDSCASNIAITYRQIGNFRAAVKWFRRAADAGDGDALIQLGIHYYWGKGVRKNTKEAVRCFRRATNANVKDISGAGREDAFFFLAVAYSEGEGVKMSIPRARKLLLRANVDDDHPAARKMLRQLEA
jgi:TPR repeat protein